MKILFWHRKNKVNAKGEAPIYCRITINGVRGTDFTTGIFCKLEHFNSKLQKIDQDEIANLKLAQIAHKINTIYIELANKGDHISPGKIQEYMNGKKHLGITLLQLMNQFREHRAKLNSVGEITHSTYLKCEVIIKNVSEFLTETKQRTIMVENINARMANDFYYWLQEKKNVGPEYAAKSIQMFKGIINYAIVNDYIKSNVFSALRFKRGRKKNIEFLKPEELEKLKSHKFASERLQQVADLFLLQCFTGFSYSDLANFDPKFHVEKEENGREWIVKPRTKNGIESVLPFMPEAKEICMKYCVTTLQGKKLNLPVITNQKYNSYLKEIGEIQGYNITLTTHIGRKTFGTIALNKGYSIESVSKMLGHSNIKTTQLHYAVVLKKRIVGEI